MKRFDIPLLVLVLLCLMLIEGSPAIAQNNVYIAFGDSITNGCCFSDVEPYPTILAELLNKTVINEFKITRIQNGVLIISKAN